MEPSLTKYKCTSHFIARLERVVQGLRVRGSWRSNINCNILTPLLWPSRCVFLVLLMLKWRPRGDGFLYCILSASSPDLSSSGPQVPSAWCGFPYHISTPLELELNWNRNSTQLARRTQLSYIIVRCPLDLWNRMFNRHQAEITIMQFRGHSLLVHQSVLALWDLHLVPYYKPYSAHAISFDYWPLECVTSFWCITLE